MATLTARLHGLLTDQRSAGEDSDLDPTVQAAIPGNFCRILAASVLTKLGDAIASPKTVLTWICTGLGAPPVVLGLLVPVRESGSMLPQILVGAWVRGRSRRTPVWLLGALLQGLAVVGMAAAALTSSGALAGWTILAAVALFSLARCLCSVASKDVLGRTIPKGSRGQLTGWAASAAGVIGMLLGAVLLLPGLADLGPVVLGAVLLGSAGLWFLALPIYGSIREPTDVRGDGAGDGAVDRLRGILPRLALLRDDAPFRRFIIARALLMGSALSAPFYVALAHQRVGSAAWMLGFFVIATGAAGMLSAPVWGRFADRSSRGVMAIAGLLTAATGVTLVGCDWFLPDLIGSSWLLPVAYGLLAIAHHGVRVGRKTHVVDLAGGDKRTDYVSVGNTLIGLLLLLLGSIGLLTPLIGLTGVIGILSALALAGGLMSLRLAPTGQV